MIRRILLLAILAGTPVAEAQAEFLFSSTELSVRSEAGASTSRPDRDPLPSPDAPEPLTVFAGQPAGMDSSGPTTFAGGGAAGALPAARAHVSSDDLVLYLLRENGCRYQQPSYAGPFKPPRAAC